MTIEKNVKILDLGTNCEELEKLYTVKQSQFDNNIYHIYNKENERLVGHFNENQIRYFLAGMAFQAEQEAHLKRQGRNDAVNEKPGA